MGYFETLTTDQMQAIAERQPQQQALSACYFITQARFCAGEAIALPITETDGSTAR